MDETERFAGEDQGPANPPGDAPTEPSDDAHKQGLLSRIIRGKRTGGPREHPYAHEVSPPEETKLDAQKVTYAWLGLATALLVAGLWFSDRFSPYSFQWFGTHTPSAMWEAWTLVPLFTSLALLGFGFVRDTWSKRITLLGWLLFAFYWGLTAVDLFVTEDQDYVNFVFALVGVYFFTYLAYHQWLSLVRGVHNQATHFLNVTAFIAAGTYFLIAKITFLRVWLIHVVGNHTKWMLDIFGQGDKKGLQFVVDKEDSQGPVTFFYPDKYCSPSRTMEGSSQLDGVSEYCRTLPYEQQYASTIPEPSGWWENLMFYQPGGGVEMIVPVSIILACTALQSIMLFVGLIFGTEAKLGRKIKMSLAVGGLVYFLNLVRNTGIIWFYGQGHASFWTMHNAIGKGGSLLAMVFIAFGIFRIFPEFFKSLVGVLDLPDRDGPIERTLKFGRRRPETVQDSSEE